MREDQWNFLDNFRRQIFIKFELKKKIIKSLEKSEASPLIYRYYATYGKGKISRISMISKHKTRCSFTGRSHGVIKKFGYSRFALRTESYVGAIPGCRRASW